MNVLSLIYLLQSVEREFQSRVQIKDRELAEAQQQLRQKVNSLFITKRMHDIFGERELVQ